MRDDGTFGQKEEWLKERGWKLQRYRFGFNSNDLGDFEFIIKIEVEGVRFFSTIAPQVIARLDMEALERYDKQVWENARRTIQGRLKEMGSE